MKRRNFVAAALPLSAGVFSLTGCSRSREITGGFTGVSVERGHRLWDQTLGADTSTTTTNTKTGTPPKPAKCTPRAC